MTTFIVVLRFAEHRNKAKELMPGHVAWLQRGFDEGAFLLAGTLQPGVGGIVLARSSSRVELEERVGRDPFVTEGVVSVEVLEIVPSRVDPRLDFLG